MLPNKCSLRVRAFDGSKGGGRSIQTDLLTAARSRVVAAAMRTRFTTLHPEGSFNMSKDIVERLLLDNMEDEVFILESSRSLDPETRAAVRKALDQMAQRSRHIGQHLIHVLRVQSTRSTPGRNEKSPPRASSASQT